MRVLLFAGESYYAKGGMNDFQGIFADVDSAKLIVDANATCGSGYYAWDWWQIIDQNTLEVLARSEWQAHGVKGNDYVPDED